MANVGNIDQLTRTWWAGTSADNDVHIEAYEGDIEGSFAYQSLFRSAGLTTFKSVQGQSNVWRGDRVGAATVQGRKSGEVLNDKRITNEKFLVTVDTTVYIRTPFDYQDDWTAPDFMAEYTQEHGIAHAKSFDEAHIIQLIKCQSFVPPTSLEGSFYPGLAATATGYSAALALNTAAGEEEAASLLVRAHKKVIEEFVNRDLGDGAGDCVTLIRPSAFSVLLEHKKLMNVEFQGGGTGEGNNFARRRIGFLNGLPVIETARFPKGARTDHPLGSRFNVSAAEAKAQMIVFYPRRVLVTVEAKGMTVRHFDWEKDFQSYLDSYAMYTVGQRRPDACAIINPD